jgi:hypothetical protein
MTNNPVRVFISYTAEDLSRHADTVAQAIQGLNMMPVDHRRWSATGRPSVEECKGQIRSCQILVVLVAHRFGWVPPAGEGGDGEQSITQIEVNYARASGLRVLPFVVQKDAEWRTDLIEGYGNPDIKARLDRFKAEMQKTLAGFFSTPVSLDGPVSRALQMAAEEIERKTLPQQGKEGDDSRDEDEVILPWTADSNTSVSLPERLGSQLPKRVLSIDDSYASWGASLAFLLRIQEVLRIRYGTEDFFLSDYYDLIVGIGRSAFIAAFLAERHDVAELQTLCQSFSFAAVGKSSPLLKRFSYMYSSVPLSEFLANVFGEEATLGSGNLRTGLLLITTRLDSSQPFAFTNHTGWDGYHRWCDLSLSRLVLACSSFPVFYPPCRLTSPNGCEEGVFTAGDASIGANPSVFGLLTVVNRRFAFKWRLGKSWLCLTSIGGRESASQPVQSAEDVNMLSSMVRLPSTLMAGASSQVKMMLEALGLETEESTAVPSSPSSLALTYRRYELSDELLSFSPTQENPFADTRIDRLLNIQAQLEASRAPARQMIDMSHFRKSFDVRRPMAGL